LGQRDIVHFMKHMHLKVSLVTVFDMYHKPTTASHLPDVSQNYGAVSDFKKQKDCMSRHY